MERPNDGFLVMSLSLIISGILTIMVQTKKTAASVSRTASDVS
jgi:hypothetical protein